MIDETIASSKSNSMCQEPQASVHTAKLLQGQCQQSAPRGDCARRAEFLQGHLARVAELSLPDASNAVCWLGFPLSAVIVTTRGHC